MIPKKGETNCVDWIHDQLDRDLTQCSLALEEVFACPANYRKKSGQELDSFWAHEEVNHGPSGWIYDPCCNQNYSTLPSNTATGAICNSSNCDYNPGAHFCIRSPSTTCWDEKTGQTLYVSNQCCYDEEGQLMSDPFGGAGRMSLTKATSFNLHHFFKNELEPFDACCENSNRCDLFHLNRPTVTGEFHGSLTAPVEFGGHFITADGLDYTFLGLGVFTLLETDLDQPTKIQISTRMMGSMTVVAGIAVSSGGHKVEFMRPPLIPEGKSNRVRNFIFINGDHMVLTDLFMIGPDDPFDVYFSGVNLKQNNDVCHIRIQMPGVNLLMNIFVVRNYLNIYVTLPDSFIGHTRGLLGVYDGVASNDFLPKSPGSKILTFNLLPV